MIRFHREDKRVMVDLSPKVAGLDDYYYTTSIDASGALHAQLIVNALNQRLADVLSEIRKTEYMKGFADAKAKRAKQTYFYTWF